MLDDEWLTTGPHQFVDCWCGHSETNSLTGKTLDFKFDRVHRWIALACEPDCALQSRIHGHVHIHCPDCVAGVRDATACC